MAESGIVYWAYLLSRHKLMDHLVETGHMDRGVADDFLEKIFEYAKESDITEFRTSGQCAEIIRTYLKPNTTKDEYISLTEIAREQSTDVPGYVIQSWLRSRNTVEFLKIWELEHNPIFDEDAYTELVEAMRTPAFTLTPKQWIARTNAVGLITKQGKNGGTLAHPDIAIDFHMWMKPELRMNLIKAVWKNDVEG